MAIVDIEAGSKASSKQLNDNFHYLQDLVGELSIKIDGSEDTVDSKIATVKNTLTNQIDTVQQDINKSLLPIGSIIAWSTPTVPAKWLPMVGQDITEYEELVSVIGTNKLPDTRKRVLWGDTTPLSTIEAGLPNITGTLKTRGGSASASGAFVISGKSEVANYDTGSQNSSFSFDASRSNAIYGKSDTVQPPAVTVVWIIKYE